MSSPVAIFREIWSAAHARARRPVSGILLDDPTATAVVEGVFQEVIDELDALPDPAALSADILSRVRAATLA